MEKMKKEYKTPQSYIHKLALPLMNETIGFGGSVPNGESNESKRNSYLINDDDNIFDDRLSYDEEESYNHFDL